MKGKVIEYGDIDVVWEGSSNPITTYKHSMLLQFESEVDLCDALRSIYSKGAVDMTIMVDEDV